ncbi:carboxylesterase family protein [Streptomyces sp. NPDC047061]|uniref:carboxylesterase family protein n=1 Tax=Streptomyces sp. NPDC047061 TaxID=3154605 RepID=UPI0033E83D67
MADIENPVVATDRGKVQGIAAGGAGGAVSFRGIPYAASPVGELRFAAPRPHPGWTGVRRIQSLTAAGVLDLLAAQAGDRAREIYDAYAARLPQGTPAQIFTAIGTDALFRDGSLQIADHHATHVYEFDYRPAEDPHSLGAAHCVELPFLFNTFDAYPDSPMLGRVGDSQRALGHGFGTAVAEFVRTGSVHDWLPYAPATPARIRHFA